jgi:hypothetical protein
MVSRQAMHFVVSMSSTHVGDVGDANADIDCVGGVMPLMLLMLAARVRAAAASRSSFRLPLAVRKKCAFW